MKRIASHWYAAHDFDSVRVEMHGDVAITYGRYIGNIPSSGEGRAWFAVWFEKIYAKRDDLFFIRALDFDRAVFCDGDYGADSGEHRRNDGANNAYEQWKLRDRSPLLFDHDAADISFSDQIFKLVKQSLTFGLYGFPPSAFAHLRAPLIKQLLFTTMELYYGFISGTPVTKTHRMD